jgi:hypothetical protein
MGRSLACLALLLLSSSARSESQVDGAVRALRTDSSLKVRAQAALVLGQRGAREAVPALREAVERDPAPAVRIAAAAALGRIRDPAGRAALEAASREDPDPKVREAASRALSERDQSAPAGALTFTIEEVSGTAGGRPDRDALRDAIEKHLRAGGYAVVDGGAYRLKPSILSMEVESGGGKTTVAVRAALVAVDGRGRMAAMLEGAARLKASGAASESALGRYAAAALDAAAKTLCEDLAARLR